MARPVYSVTVKDTASDYLARLARGLERQEYGQAVGEAGVVALDRHLADKQQDPSSHRTAQRLGASPSGMYAEMARSLSHSTTREGVLISINHVAAAQRYFGGTIKPTGGRKYLTLPAIAEAYGVRATDAPVGLTAMIRFDPTLGRPRAVALKADDPTPTSPSRRRRRERGAPAPQKGEIWYWLVESVTQRADPTVLPDDDQLAQTITRALAGWLEDL